MINEYMYRMDQLNLQEKIHNFMEGFKIKICPISWKICRESLPNSLGFQGPILALTATCLITVK